MILIKKLPNESIPHRHIRQGRLEQKGQRLSHVHDSIGRLSPTNFMPNIIDSFTTSHITIGIDFRIVERVVFFYTGISCSVPEDNKVALLQVSRL